MFDSQVLQFNVESGEAKSYERAVEGEAFEKFPGDGDRSAISRSETTIYSAGPLLLEHTSETFRLRDNTDRESSRRILREVGDGIFEYTRAERSGATGPLFQDPLEPEPCGAELSQYQSWQFS